MEEISPLSPINEADALISAIGQRVRARRRELGLSRRALSEASDVSQRYLAQVEGGHGNISVALLQRIGVALDRKVTWFVDETHGGEAGSVARMFSNADEQTRKTVLELLGAGGQRDGASKASDRIALIGLRGAGKSTLGRRASSALDMPFVELNDEISEQAGITVGDIIALYGQEGYRRLEHQALTRVIERHDRMVLAVAGGIVGAEETYRMLCDHFRTIWLRAAPGEHMERVRAQGDDRPMAGNPAALDALKSILNERERLYAQADAIVDTTGRTEDRSLSDVLEVIAGTNHR